MSRASLVARWGAAGAGLAAALGLALACAEAGAAGRWAAITAQPRTASPAASQRARAKPVTHTVTIDASRYEPARLRIRAGDTVVWVNKDVIPHTATAGNGAFDSGTLAAGASWRSTVRAKGTTDYACRFHPAMTAAILAE